MRKQIAILTDFGISDNYNGVMEAVIKRNNPEVEITYITPNAREFSIYGGAYLLYTSYRYFKKGTIFLTVIDPGVGTSRKPIIIKTNNYFFVGPDNGVLYPASNEDGIKEIIAITNPRVYLSKKISNTFHGRDIFAISATLLSLNVDLETFGEKITDLVKLSFDYSLEELSDDKIKACGKVIYVDHFGNIATSIRIDNDLSLGKRGKLLFKGKEIDVHQVRTFGESKSQEILVYKNGYSFIEIGINKGSAFNILGLREGDEICVEVSIQADSNHSI
ncbi:SAM hydrolase/SAM-dependent halogenase family protein [Stygiolobus caldivivus]|uniref:S-adenosyl-l-methionine hydroxide adenosyltransferase n=1 Tax=Stygiolobus caldivivus TaxID=2824673 RepID=A0A8D5U868_9CREN|nr:SAM-dependent chlorinase/fluorinase [Stygiolobus caldivivus]BCU70566.1 hypothetical protein KN1_18630 [Stygiolobus caldivivus]